MAKSGERVYGDDVPDEVVDRLRAICAELPDAYEEVAWKGVRWRVRKRTFAHVLSVRDGDADPYVVLTFRSEGEELEALRRAGPPFYPLDWGRTAVGMVIDEHTDWSEMAELLTESFCVMAPQKLATVSGPEPWFASPHR